MLTHQSFFFFRKQVIISRRPPQLLIYVAVSESVSCSRAENIWLAKDSDFLWIARDWKQVEQAASSSRMLQTKMISYLLLKRFPTHLYMKLYFFPEWVDGSMCFKKKLSKKISKSFPKLFPKAFQRKFPKRFTQISAKGFPKDFLKRFPEIFLNRFLQKF